MNYRLLILLLLLGTNVFAQKKTTTIHILNADKADYDERLGKDVQRLIGNVVMRQDSTYFYSDSAYYNEKTKFFDGFGNVHINVNDSVDIYSKLLKYNGETKFAELFHDVILKDDSTVLRTQYMTYDRMKHLATYPNRGTITRNDKKLVSKKGYYRDDIKVLYFRKDVVGTMPDYRIVSDTLVYDTDNEMMYFHGPTTIYNKENVLYDASTGEYTGLPHAERLYDYELGYTYSHPRFAIGANLYFMDYDNQLVLTGEYNDVGAYKTKNVKDSYRMGAELTAGVKITNWLRWDGNLVASRNKILNYHQYIDLYDDQDNWNWVGQDSVVGTTTIAFSPTLTASSLFTFDIAGFTATVQTNVVSKQYLDNTEDENAMLRAYSTTIICIPKQIPIIGLP